jgi:hypothetical protein
VRKRDGQTWTAAICTAGMLVCVLLAALTSPAQASEDCPLSGYWAGTAWSIDLKTNNVGKSVHGCMVYPDCRYGCDTWGVDRERGDCVRKGVPYYGRMVPFGPLWRTETMEGEHPSNGLNVVVVSGEAAEINHISAAGLNTATTQFVERTSLIRLGDTAPATLIDAQRYLWFLECDQ